jgi:putative ABC transport system permease protein
VTAPPGRAVIGWRVLAGRSTSVMTGLLVLVTVFLAVALPRASASLRTQALHQALAGLPASADAVTAGIDVGDYEQGACAAAAGCTGGITAQLAATQQQLARFLTRGGVPLQRQAGWAGLASGSLPVTAAPPSAYIDGAAPQFQLGYADALSRNAVLTAGRWPGGVTTSGGTLTFQLAVTTATARRFGLRVGSRLGVGVSDSVVVTGLIRPASPRSAFWSQFANFAAPATIATVKGGYWTGSGFVGPAAAAAMADPQLTQATAMWVFPLNLSQATAGQAGQLLTVLSAAASQGPAQLSSLSGSGASFELTSGVTQVIGAFVTGQAAANGIVSLLFASLTVLGILAVLMAAQQLADSRREEFATMLARGATRRQLGWLAAAGNALVALPAAAIAAAVAVGLTRGGGTPLAWWLACLTTGTAVAGPALLALRSPPAGRPGGRRRLPLLRRLVLDLTLTAVAVAGVIIVRQQGLSPGGNLSPLASLAPVLVAVPAALVAVRLWPVLVRVALRPARRSRNLPVFVGLARGADRTEQVLLPVFALVLALSVVAFGGAIASGIRQGEAAAAWQQAGADAVVGSPAATASLPLPAQRAIAALRGVHRWATVIEEPGQTGSDGAGTPFNVAVVNPPQYAAVLAATPAAPFPAAALSRRPGPVPVIASASAASLLRQAGDLVTIGQQIVRVSVTGQISGTPAAQPGTPFLILPLWAAGPHPLPPSMMLLAGSQISSAQLTAVAARTAPGATVMVRSVVAAQLAGAPLPRATLLEYAAGSGAAALLSILIVVLMLLAGARSRLLTDIRLSTMGVTPGQARRAGLVEVAPLVLAAAVAGTAAAVALSVVLSPVISLASLTGSAQGAALHSGVLIPVLAGVALVIIALALMAGQDAIAARHGPARTLRAGE